MAVYPKYNDAGGIGATLMASGATTAPAGGTSLGGITTPAAVYRVLVGVMMTGTQETSLNNLRLRLNGNLLMALPTSALNAWVTFEIPRLVVTAGNLDIHTAVAPVAGATYNMILTATRVE